MKYCQDAFGIISLNKLNSDIFRNYQLFVTCLPAGRLVTTFMHIENYEFGKIKVDGELYENDLIIYPDKIEEDWRRKEEHNLQEEDIEAVLELEPDYLVVGIGYSGQMKVAQPLRNALREKEIQLEDHKSPPATVRFNQLTEEKEDKEVVGAFHLTC